MQTLSSTDSLSLLPPSEQAPLPDRILTDWRRFSSGLWRVPEGDIYAAYSADIVPRIKVFCHEGRMFSNLGCDFGPLVVAVANCYPLLPFDDYAGPPPRERSYEGIEAIHGGKRFRLGPKVAFAASDPTPAQWQILLRVLYADGGMFAAECTYYEFLAERFFPDSGNGRITHAEELARCETLYMPETQEEMNRFLEQGAEAPKQPEEADQPRQEEFVF